MAIIFSYPLDFVFNLLAINPQFSVTDANGGSVAFIKQKAFKFKEDVSVFRDESQKDLLYKIKADKWLDWSASYKFTDSSGNSLGRVARKGAKSIFKAHYELFDENDQQDLLIKENSFMVRFLDALVGGIPIIGIFTGYFLNPSYNISRPDGTVVALFSKKPSFVGRRFKVEKMNEFEQGEEKRILLGLMMMVLLERSRG